MTKPTVSVIMITYGHEQFIKQAIEGVLMQQCDFDVELIIADDCSPDITESIVNDICQTHSNASWIKYTKHKNNLGMMPNFIFALQQAEGKYIALCEGDDYWTDHEKLQKQVDFLEENPDYNLVGHHAINSFENKIGVFEKDSYSFDSIYFRNLRIPTASLVFRNNIEIPEWFKKVYGGDRGLIFLNAKIGDIKILPFMGSFYRIHEGGVEQLYKKDKFKKPIRNINEEIIYYNLTKNLPKSHVLRNKIIKNYLYIIIQSIMRFKPKYFFMSCYSLFLFLIIGKVKVIILY